VEASFCKIDRKRTILQQISIKQSNSTWKKQVYESHKKLPSDEVYSLNPFIRGYSDVPYLVGSYEEVIAYIQKYIDSGIESLIIEIPNTGYNEIDIIGLIIDRLKL